MKVREKIRSANIHYLPGKFYFGPKWVVMGVNNVCNLHCKMCDVGTGNLETNFSRNLVGTHPLNMPEELFFKVVDQLHQSYPKCRIGYAFTEPLVYPHLFSTLDYANSKGMYTSITTNAFNLKRKADELIRSGLNELFISLDGLQDTHNYIRGNKKSFQKALEGIEYLMEHKKRPEISVYAVITNWNQAELSDFAKFFSKYPLKHLGFMHTNFVTREVAENHNRMFGGTYPATHSNIQEMEWDKYDLDVVWEQIQTIKGSFYPFGVSFTPDVKSKEELRRYYFEPTSKFGKLCEDVFSNIMIKSDGSVIPAHGRCYNLQLGNLYETDLKSIWDGKVLSEFRQSIMKEGGLLPACTRCCSAF